MPACARIIATLILGGLGLMATTCSAHPTHVSLADARWNAKTGKLELVVRLVADHLEDAVKEFTRDEDFRLEQENAEESLRAYVQSRFAVILNASEPAAECDLHWVGMEVKTQDVWVYFEFKLPADWEQLILHDSLLFDVVREQTNIVSVRVDGKSKTLIFSPDHPKLTLRRRDAATISESSN